MSEKDELMQEVGIFIPTIFSAELIDKDGNKRSFTMECEPCIEESTENTTVMKCRLLDEEGNEINTK